MKDYAATEATAPHDAPAIGELTIRFMMTEKVPIYAGPNSPGVMLDKFLADRPNHDEARLQSVTMIFFGDD